MVSEANDLICFDPHQLQEMLLQDALNDEFDSSNHLRRLLTETVSFTGAELGMILMLDKPNKSLSVVATTGYDEDDTKAMMSKDFNLSGNGIISWVAKNRTPYLCENCEDDKNYLECVAGVKSECAAPVLVKNELWGVLNIESKSIPLNPNHLNKLNIVASLSGLLIQLEQKLKRSMVRQITIDTIQEVSNSILSNNITDQRLSRGFAAILKKAVRITKSNGGQIFLPTANGLKLNLISQIGETEQGQDNFNSIQLGNNICGNVAETGKCQLIYNIKDVPQFLPILKDSKSELAIPIKIKDNPPYGVLNLESINTDHFTIHDRVMCELFASELAMYLRMHNAQKMAEFGRAKPLIDNAVVILTHRLKNYIEKILDTIILYQQAKEGDSDAEEMCSEVLNIIDSYHDFEAKIAQPFETVVMQDINTTDLNVIVKELFSSDELQRICREKRIKIACSPADQHSRHKISCSIPTLREAIIDIATNAVEALPPEGQIVINSVLTQDFLLLTIADDGVGLPPEFDTTLQTAWRSDPRGKFTKEKGNGLGLYSARSSLLAMNADLFIDTDITAEELGMDQVSTAFTIRLPIATGDESAQKE